MKKIVAMITMLLVASAATAFAGTTYAGAAGAEIKAGASSSEKSIAKLSTGVSARVVYDNTAYAAGTKHQNGTKEFGSSSGDTRIYSKDNASLEAFTASDSSSFSGWTTL